jgi:hypothetical protein
MAGTFFAQYIFNTTFNERDKMKKHPFWVFLFLCVMSQTIFANDTQTFHFNGQETESVNLDTSREVTLFRTEYRDSTCTRQEPYQVEECGYETLYRNECTWQAGRNVCRDVNDYQCRNVTRYRRECKPGRTRRECTEEPARRVCRTRNGVERCVDVPGRTRCRDVQGPERCTRVPYEDRECRTVTRQECSWQPGRNVCRDVPYQEYICRDVTRYRDVDYACQVPVDVPYQAQKQFKSTVNFEFVNKFALGDAEITSKLNDSNKFVTKFKNLDKENSYIQISKKNTEVITDTDELFESKTTYLINFGSIEELTKPLNANAKSLWMNKAGAFVLKVGHIDSLKRSNLEITVKKRSSGDLHFKKLINYKDFIVDGSDLKTDLSKFGFERIKGFLGRGVKLNVAIKTKIKMPANLTEELNIKTEKSKSFNIKVYKNKNL